MDTVEWGSVEPARRRFPSWRLAVPRAGAVALGVVGFGLLVAAEFEPWVTDTDVLTGTTPRVTPFSSSLRLSLGMETVGTPSLAYHLGALALLALLGLLLASPGDRRRLPLGLALGVAAGQLLIVVSVIRIVQRTLASTVTGGGQGFLLQQGGLRPDQVLASGAYLAVLGVLALAGAAVVAALWRREPARATPPTETADPVAADEDRDLRVTPLEPLDDSYFARE